jgi:hypothetical protein
MAELRRLEPNFRKIAEVWVESLGEADLRPVVTSTRRTFTEQAKLFRAAQRPGHKYPAAPPGHSVHEWGMAFDVVLTPHSALFLVGPVWEKLGLGLWGGRFKDEIHFEATGAMKKAAGYDKRYPYDPTLEHAYNPLELLLRANLLSAAALSILGD